MERAGVHPGELDIIVLGTASPDRLLPSAAVDLQAALGASRAAAFDIGAACSGFIYGATVAEGMIATGNAETVLVVGVEKLSAIIDWTRSLDLRAVRRRRRRGGPQALEAAAREFSRRSCAATARSAICSVARPAARRVPFAEQVLADRSQFIKMTGREVFKHAVRSMSEAADRALDAAKLTGADIDLLIPHQANVRIIEATAKHANIPMDKVYVNVDRYGNTSAASVPIALDEAIERGVDRRGIDRAARRVRRRLHVGLDDRSPLSHGRRSSVSGTGIAEARHGKGSRRRVSRRRATSSSAPTTRSASR